MYISCFDAKDCQLIADYRVANISPSTMLRNNFPLSFKCTGSNFHVFINSSQRYWHIRNLANSNARRHERFCHQMLLFDQNKFDLSVMWVRKICREEGNIGNISVFKSGFCEIITIFRNTRWNYSSKSFRNVLQICQVRPNFGKVLSVSLTHKKCWSKNSTRGQLQLTFTFS